MSLLSATTLYHGLENAGITEKTQCTGEKIKNNLKGAIGATALGISAGTAAGLAIKYQPVADSFAKVFDKGASVMKKTGMLDTIKDIGTEAIKYAKANPKTAKAIALISGLALVGTSALQIKHIYENGKVEGKYQAITDAKNN